MSGVRVQGTVKDDIECIILYRKKMSPHKTVNKQSVSDDLITKEAKRVRRIMGGLSDIQNTGSK